MDRFRAESPESASRNWRFHLEFHEYELRRRVQDAASSDLAADRLDGIVNSQVGWIRRILNTEGARKDAIDAIVKAARDFYHREFQRGILEDLEERVAKAVDRCVSHMGECLQGSTRELLEKIGEIDSGARSVEEAREGALARRRELEERAVAVEALQSEFGAGFSTTRSAT